MTPAHTVHLAGPDIRSATHVRQLCAWCGTRLLNLALVDAPPAPVMEEVEVNLNDLIPTGGTLRAIRAGSVMVQPPAPPGSDGVPVWEPLALVALPDDGSPGWAVPRDQILPDTACVLR